MEPLTLTTIAATLVLTKALEKTGEKLGEEVIEQGTELLKLIKERFPKTGSAIERVRQQSLPLDGGEAYLDAEFTEIAQEVTHHKTDETQTRLLVRWNNALQRLSHLEWVIEFEIGRAHV